MNTKTEILQSQKPSELNADLSYKIVGEDISCNLGSLNAKNLIDSPDFDKTINTAMRALTHVTETLNLESVPSITNGNNKNHTVGLGVMSLHELFATNQIEYGSPESLEATNILYMMINYYSLKASNQIAIEKGSFSSFNTSTYASGEYFDKYITDSVVDEYSPTFIQVAELFKNHHIPTVQDWKELKESVMEDGLYHAYRLATAPNGSISYIQEATASAHPITAVVEGRQEKKIGKIYYPAPGLDNETLPYYTSAYDMSMLRMIDVYAEAQKHVDQGMNLTLFMRSDIPKGLYPWKPNGGKMTTKDLTLIRHYAWKKGIKTLYYTRTLTDDDSEVGITECESCSI